MRQNYEDLQTKEEDFYDISVENNSVENFVQFISQVDISAESKWNYIEIFNKPSKYYSELAGMILMNEKAYDDAYEDIKDYINNYMDDFKIDVDKNINDIEENIGLIVDKTKTIDVYPMIARNRNISYMESEDDTISIFYLGILVNTICSIKKLNTTNGKYLMGLIKNLGDKSKFEILTLLKNKEMYGQQIAEALNLTTATISYHMNDLFVCNFVKIHRTDTRVYYSLNKEEINKFIDNLQQYFE